jgi:hypothetical protein
VSQQTVGPLQSSIEDLADPNPAVRKRAAEALFEEGIRPARAVLENWAVDAEFSSLLTRSVPTKANFAAATVGIAVFPKRFEEIHRGNGSPPFAHVPPDQDAREFELNFGDGARVDILTPRNSGGSGAIARFLERSGEGIQQVEFEVCDVERATQILRDRFRVTPVYPATRAGADGTRVNFFLVAATDRKVLIELVEGAETEQV